MIKLEYTTVNGLREAFRAMRNPLDSWAMSDSKFDGIKFVPGKNDLALARRLALAGDDHGKFTRFITVIVDITAPRYFLTEFDTYKVGTVCNSCSTMHTLLKRDLTLADVSTDGTEYSKLTIDTALKVINTLMRDYREATDPDKKKQLWKAIIQMLPQSFMQRRTWMGDYMVLHHMRKAREGHKLTEWHTFCKWVDDLPYYKQIYGETE